MEGGIEYSDPGEVRYILGVRWVGRSFQWCDIVSTDQTSIRPFTDSVGWEGECEDDHPLENMWLKDEGFKDLVKSWWMGFSFRGSPSFILAEKLKSLKSFLKRWDIDIGNVVVKKRLALSQLDFWDSKELKG